jgi:hypothetical protein
MLYYELYKKDKFLRKTIPIHSHKFFFCSSYTAQFLTKLPRVFRTCVCIHGINFYDFLEHKGIIFKKKSGRCTKSASATEVLVRSGALIPVLLSPTITREYAFQVPWSGAPIILVIYPPCLRSKCQFPHSTPTNNKHLLQLAAASIPCRHQTTWLTLVTSTSPEQL